MTRRSKILGGMAGVLLLLFVIDAPWHDKNESTEVLTATSQSAASSTPGGSSPLIGVDDPQAVVVTPSSRANRSANKPRDQADSDLDEQEDFYRWDLDQQLADLRQGEVGAAYKVTQMIGQCFQVPRNEEEMVFVLWSGGRLHRGAEAFFEGTAVISPDELANVTRTYTRQSEIERFETPLDHYLAMLEVCAPLHAALDQGLMNEVHALARDGNLAAIWVHALTRRVSVQEQTSFRGALEWQAETVERMARLEKSDPLVAYLIYGFSRFWHAFTPADYGLGAAYHKAAVNCGAPKSWFPGGWRMMFEREVGDFAHGARSTREAEERMAELFFACGSETR